MTSPRTTNSRRLAINAEWFGRLRWVASAGQLATIAFVSGVLGVATPVAPLLVLVGVTLMSNGLFFWWKTTRTIEPSRVLWQRVLGGLMLLDLMVLTAMLALTGGPTNPFVVFYFVNLALSGIVLPSSWAWGLSVLAIGAVGLLSLTHTPIDALRDPDRLQSVLVLRSTDRPLPLAVLGAWIAFTTSAAVLVSFTTRLTAELIHSDRARRRAEKESARNEKLEALGTLAAGAAHELATPLSTIALTVSEAYRELQKIDADSPAAEDLALARREVDRCRSILDRMATDSGQASAGLPEELTAERLVDDVLGGLRAARRVDVEWGEGARDLLLIAPATALAQAIRAVVQNAIDAADEIDPAGRVTLACDPLADALRLRVIDRGPGIRPDVLERLSEPFFTTKPPGRGMGLGLFLTRSVIEKLGGSLRHESPATGGTIATIVLPPASP